MSATAEMPYFVRPSQNLPAEEKERAYAQAYAAIAATLTGETNELVVMVTINSVLKTYLPYFYWTGFYLVSGPDRLSVGPYQGTLGCLHIEFGRGVCGTVAASGRAKIVADTHALEEGREHIACDPNSRSEIVLPVRRPDGSLLGVFDVDSTECDSFDAVDQRWLEKILSIFSDPVLPLRATWAAPAVSR
ncbi:GAF domain-containing protein [Lewinella marina]|uniref:Diguanylate phosphodiesterase n=1 Tax=Neolewinella marina TaxID=438751 RepID=A0A2G0CD07_9BACT|nr:GAF domain-containing protein [Neolewinella marina]NJB86943.1 GAF domain-containing protein [Neolewinella marina]PHK97861.1 diguanylate phosphodiesterase [Neolewinella marina]